MKKKKARKREGFFLDFLFEVGGGALSFAV